MKLLENQDQIRDLLQRYAYGDSKLGLVSTMGNIHEGHLSLIKKAREMADAVVVTVAANPLLLRDREIVAHFEAQRDSDIHKLEKADVDYACFIPADELFPVDFKSFVHPEAMIRRFESVDSPDYLIGLATAYFKLLNLFHPNFVFIGQKNYLDFHLVKQLSRDYGLSTEVVLAPTVRDEKGIPYTSFQDFHTPDHVAASARIYQSLREARRLLLDGETRSGPIIDSLTKNLAETDQMTTRFVDILDPRTLEPLETVGQEALIMIIAQVGKFRVTDNIFFRRNTD